MIYDEILVTTSPILQECRNKGDSEAYSRPELWYSHTTTASFMSRLATYGFRLKFIPHDLRSGLENGRREVDSENKEEERLNFESLESGLYSHTGIITNQFIESDAISRDSVNDVQHALGRRHHPRGTEVA